MLRHYERLPDGSTPGTYRKPDDGWVCFHCGVRFLTEAAAAEHFGKAPGNLPGCRRVAVPTEQAVPTYSYYEMCGDKTVWHRIDDALGEPVNTLDEAYAQARIDAREIGRVNFTITVGNRSDPAFETMNSATVKLAARRDFDSVTEATGHWRVM